MRRHNERVPLTFGQLRLGQHLHNAIYALTSHFHHLTYWCLCVSHACAHTYTWTSAYTHASTHTHIHVYMHTCLHTCTCIFRTWQTCIYRSTHMYIHMHTYMHIHMCIHIRMSIRIHIEIEKQPRSVFRLDQASDTVCDGVLRLQPKPGAQYFTRRFGAETHSFKRGSDLGFLSTCCMDTQLWWSFFFVELPALSQYDSESKA